MRKRGKLLGFRLEYRAEVLLRNAPDSRYGVKGEAKNRAEVSSDGEIFLDFESGLFPRPPLRTKDVSAARALLGALEALPDLSRPAPAPPYLPYVDNFALFSFSDEEVKWVLDDVERDTVSAMKSAINAFLAPFSLRLDWGEKIPQGVYRYIQVRTEKSEKEYSYFYGGELSPGERVIVPFGTESEETQAVVTSVEYWQEKDVPYPVGKIKRILRPVGKED